MALLPAYLSSSTSLIKSLKAAQDPPQEGFPSKIDIAREAWRNENVYVPRKAEVLREWVVECWSRTGKGKGKDFSAHPVLVPGYHKLLLDVSQTSQGASTSSTTISPPLSILQSLFGLSTTQHPNDVNELVVLAGRTMPLLFPRNSTSYKAEAWAEAWTAMISFVATLDAAVLNAAAQEALRQLAELVSKSTVTSLSGSQNRRKIAQAAFSALPSLDLAFRAHPYLVGILQPAIMPIYLPFAVLQSHSPSPLGLILPAIPTSPLLLPVLLTSYIAAVHASRYTLFPPTTSSKLPPDVYIASMVRKATQVALDEILQHVDGVSCFEARCGIWGVISDWGGYLEGEAGWTALLASEGRRVERSLRDGTDDAQWVLRTCAILVSLDHAAADVNEEILGFCLMAGDSSKAVFTSLITFHTLTHTTPAFFTLLTSSLESLFTPAADHPKVYQQVAGGILTSSWLARELTRMLRSSFIGGKRGRVWAEIVASLNNSLKQAQEAKRHVPGTEVRIASTETLGLLSRVLRTVVESAVGVEDANEAAADAVASLSVWNVPLEGKEKKRKTVSIDDIALAALVRLSKVVSRLAFAAGSEVKDDLARIVGMLEMSSGEATLELAEWVVQILSTQCLGDDDKSTSSRAVDAVLAQIKTSPVPWDGRVATASSSSSMAMWSLLAERGLVLLELIATSEQLDVLAASLVGAFDECEPTGEVITRILSTAEFWELARFRVALLSQIRVAAAADDATALKAFTVAGFCPTSYLSKNLRGALIDTAYALDRKAVNAGLRRFLLRLAIDFSVLGPLATDFTTLEQFMIAPSGDTRKTTRDLLSKAFAVISQELIQQLIKSCKARKPFSAVCKALRKGKHIEVDDASINGLLLLESQKQPDADLAALAVKYLDAAISSVVEGTVAVPIAITLLDAWAALLPVAKRAGVLDRCTTNRTPQLLQVCKGLEVACMRVVVAEATAIDDHSLVLAAYIAIASHGISDELDAAFVPEATSYTAQLTDVAESLTSVSEPRLLALLQAAKILLRARVEGAGRAVTEFNFKVLNTLQGVQRSPAVFLSVLDLVETIVTQRIVQIQLSEVNLVCDILHRSLLPSQGPRATATQAGVLHHALNTIYTLSRHRPDLVLATLPLITAFLSATFIVLQAPRDSLGGKVRSRAMARLPIWISESQPLGEGEARRFARVLTTMCSRSSRTAAAGDDKISLAGPFSKHAPAVLVAYVRAVADPSSGLSTAVRKELEPGLFALCEVITAGGKAEGREGEGVGEAFGLGEVTGDAEREVWADLWRRWGKERYVGQG